MSLRLMRLLFALTVLLAFMAAAVFPAVAADQTVMATPSNEFTPATVTIDQGDTVTWKNGGGQHNVKFDDGSFEQPADPSSLPWTVSRTFPTAGTFPYYCELHGGPGGVGMSGTVLVKSPSGTIPPPPTPTRVSLRVSDSTPRSGQRVRFYGSVRPEQDGRLVYIQRRTRSGKYRTVARARLRDAGTTRSRYSRRLRVRRDGTFRALVRADATHATGKSRRRRVNVH